MPDVGARSQRPLLATFGIAAAVAGLVIGTEFAARNGLTRNAPHAGSAASASPGMVDVIHNPPLIFETRQPLLLEFKLVCPGRPCGGTIGELELMPDTGMAQGSATTLTEASDDGSYSFAVPAGVLAGTRFSYRVTFDTPAGTVRYPDGGGVMAAVGEADARVLDLGVAEFDSGKQEAGTTVAEGSWGEGDGQYGLTDAMTGPRSFDIATDGTVVVLDRANDRLVVTDKQGHTATQPITLGPGELDIAVELSGRIDVLYANAVSGAYVERFAATGGPPLDRVELGTSSGNFIRTLGDVVYVEGDDSFWMPVIRNGEPVPPEDQISQATPGVTDTNQLVVLKHMREKGNEVRVATERDGEVHALKIVGDTALGPVLVATPLPTGEAVAVVTQFDNTHAQASVVVLGSDGTVDKVFVVPQPRYADAYVTMRVAGDHLYQATSSKDGYAVVRYSLGEQQ